MRFRKRKRGVSKEPAAAAAAAVAFGRTVDSASEEGPSGDEH